MRQPKDSWELDGKRYEMSLDRIDVNGNYTKENCRWAMPTTQAYNRRKMSSNTSGRTGVSFDESKGKWAAYITKDKVAYGLGVFSLLEEAIKAREEAELELYGYIKEVKL